MSSSKLSEDDLYLFNQGRHFQLYNHLGAHPLPDGQGTYFAVWAPSADNVSVIGTFNQWRPDANMLSPRGASGIWEGVVEAANLGDQYKYNVGHQGNHQDKADPMGFWHQTPPQTASVISALEYTWSDAQWLKCRDGDLDRPINIYELHAGSWRRDGDWIGYEALANMLIPYLKEMGYTHVELLPITEHPFYGSWGYQTTGFFAPTSRYGRPEDLMRMIDLLHQNNIGVILDWVPSHFPEDAFGLAKFDGTHLYEHADPRKGFHPDWKSCIFNYDRHEVRSFLISSALFWLEVYHIDALRVDAVASMLYLDYSRAADQWIPNEFGGRENLGAIEFLKQLNDAIHARVPGAWTIAEESTAWPGVTKPTDEGGLGFDMKWDMGWMNDTLEYLKRDPIHRQYHHNELTFRSVYAQSERYILSLSHDEVVHEKGSLLQKMAGDRWQQFANLRLLYGYMQALPGKSLLFMGQEFGQYREWNHDETLDWHLLDDPQHAGLKRWSADLNHFAQTTPALYELDFDEAGFQWVDGSNDAMSLLSFLRRSKSGQLVLVALNFTPVPRYDVWLGVPKMGRWVESLNSDASIYGGSDVGNLGGVDALDVSCHGFDHHVEVTLPPLGAVFLTCTGDD